jgi:8-oxo-dGTP pyrophosphatase MutT (NUDIX family)
VDWVNALSIRTSVSAVIVRDRQILLSAFDDSTGLHYNYPGGGIEPGESASDAVRREVLEETGAIVTQVGRLLLAWEYVPARDGERYGPVPKLGLMFECAIADFDEPLTPTQPDEHQTGVRWAPLDELPTLPVLPNIARPLLNVLQAHHAGAAFITHL